MIAGEARSPAAVTFPVTAPAPDPFRELVTERSGPDGEIGVELALDLFATRFGGALDLGATALDGVDVGGTTAVRAVAGVWSELNDDQHRAINDLLATDHAPDTTVEGWRRTPPSEPLGGLVTRADDLIAGLWGERLGHPIDAAYADLPGDDDGISYDTTADGGLATTPAEVARCVVRVDRPLVGDAGRLWGTVVHEVFHCYQSRLYVGLSPLWIVEGQAAWVEASVGCCDAERHADRWNEWLADGDLRSRSYDAIGLYGTLETAGVDMWSLMRQQLERAGGPLVDQISLVLGMAPADLAIRLATNQSNRRVFGEQWSPHGAGAPTTGGRTDAVTLPPGAVLTIEGPIPSLESRSSAIEVTDPVIEVRVDGGPLAVGSATTTITAGDGETTRLCVARSCVCPNGTTPGTTALDESPDIVVGTANTTGQKVTAVATVSGLSLDLACRLPVGTPVVAVCLTGTWQLDAASYGAGVLPGIEAVALSGGVGGRTLVIDATLGYTMTDAGSDPVRATTDAGGLPVTVTVALTGTLTGVVGFSQLDRLSFTRTGGAMVAKIVTEMSGVDPIVMEQDATALPIGLTGEAVVTCDDARLVLSFSNVTYTYRRQT